MQKLIKLWTLGIVFSLFTFSSYAGSPGDVNESLKPSPTKMEKKAERLEKFLNSKVGKWMIKRVQKKIEKRQDRLAKRLAKAEQKGKDKQIQRIKEKQKTMAGGAAVTIIIVGLVLLLLGLLIPDGGILAVLGLVAIIVGLILYLI